MDEERIRASFERALNDETAGASFLHRLLELKITADAEGATVEFQHQKEFANRRGNLHGGVVALLCDVAMGNLHRAALGPGVTVEMRVQYINSVESGLVVCRARFLKAGKRISFIEARVTNSQDQLIAAASATFARVRLEPEV